MTDMANFVTNFNLSEKNADLNLLRYYTSTVLTNS